MRIPTSHLEAAAGEIGEIVEIVLLPAGLLRALFYQRSASKILVARLH